ncbi:DUF2243 domain-containing protein [Sphingomonas sp. BN140010]|uniref:DUF2243 domain-containing protein n=1 Tax=Sphingomonas arvum TaxID=2992113 RepID=A0ABT3JI50_9SPHN|nr:DUF2243 domain-containing protein [Sphingomonas sp. BN140010]MCW3798732.1 DUF2243 domain-containing protein [Sphingomonas sp. BN140010]
MARTQVHGASLAPAGIVLGIGLGGFFDGILLHQILQWHNMLSARLPPTTMANMKTNMMADGLFHAFSLLATIAGIALLWNALKQRGDFPPSGLALVGYLLAGWGWFNLVEGVIDHHILQLHHVLETLGVSAWDWLFLASGVVLIGVGHVMGRRRHFPGHAASAMRRP